MDKCLKKFLAKKEQSEETAIADIKENVSTNTALFLGEPLHWLQ